MFKIISSDFSKEKKKTGERGEVRSGRNIEASNRFFISVPFTHVKDAWTMIININFKYVLDKHMPSFIFVHVCYCPMSA